MSIRGNGRPSPQWGKLQPFALRPVLAVGALLAAVLIALSGRYGFHRDELYFLMAGQHPAWGYVDQPPLTPLLARAASAVLGPTPTGLRVLPALLSGCSVLLTALLARETGAGRGGQLLAAGCCACSGYVLAVGHLLSTSTFDLTAQLGVLLLTLRLLRTGAARWWPALGAAVGVTLLNKQLVLSLLLALLVGVLVSRPPRGSLRRPVAGVLLALLVAAAVSGPTLWWQAAHGWPELEVARVISHIEGVSGRLLFLPLQLLQFSPLLVPIALVGLRSLLRSEELRWARPLAVAYPVLCGLVLVGGGKPYYPLPLLLAVTAAGCEPALQRAGRSWRSLRPQLLLAAATSALAALPLLPVSTLAVPNAVDADQGEQVGWPELVRATAAAWAVIPADQRPHAALLVSNYGEAGALARYGPAQGLPTAYSGHMSLYDWGPPPDGDDGPVLLLHQADSARLEEPFTDCRTLARIDSGHHLANQEQHAALVLCTGPHRPWSALWPGLRQY
ncbi:ArnT family glycosyltransferase [Kitasatospora sp. McL0602]|uniref:ArnT family glycosyltransferase n=1 Tax=Kitasatospora sp. McL0602 TaxID=3439530 RepID=UPI003F8CB223